MLTRARQEDGGSCAEAGRQFVRAPMRRGALLAAARIGHGVCYFEAMELSSRSARIGFGVLCNEATRGGFKGPGSIRRGE